MTSEDIFALVIRIIGFLQIISGLNELVNAVASSVAVAHASHFAHVELGAAIGKVIVHMLIGLVLIVFVSRITRLVFASAK
ncbi:MAG: hypothetical protein EPN75_09470 [Beijerinckiaceae bacterium]|nr:MAG: hypothetical protein EPN75_09470 [Beijerinckiaceae bacterium]